ncbi:MAG TPA: aquaporin, partial [Sphingobium sp.]|nr:aquaporin [Sphingobium sp.]
LLVATVIGSGIMAERLSGGNVALALLANTIATGAVLYVLITLLGPVSGAQFNPAVTLLLETDRPRLPIILAQVAGGMAGAVLAHLMFDMATVSYAAKLRTGPGQWLSEAVATFGLLLTIRLGLRHRPDAVPALVACWIVAAYWFTASTSFANPAVTMARALTDSFAGIRWIDVPAFIAAQAAGALIGNITANLLIGEKKRHESDHLAQPGLRHLAQDAGDP